ncbi:MAG: DUF4159 domain-containing protein [Candidatus Brocadiaceae bacterium]|nr:DUF4159 domain-containing protein [Candidatus Brocadiaceae bacterium]
MSHGRCGGVGLACVLILCVVGARPALGQQVSSAAVQRRVEALTRAVRARQLEDGSFRDPEAANWPVGHTALAVLGLRTAGVPANDRAVRDGAAYLARTRAEGRHGVYESGLRIMALESVDSARYAAEIEATAGYLIRAQQPSGGWSYGLSGRTDNSNTQFAILGLNSAALCGVTVPEIVWRRAGEYLAVGQNRDGGWGYQHGTASYGSMTAAGVAGLFICDLWLHVQRGRCGIYTDASRVANGLNWLAENFSVAVNPRRDATYKFYYLYALERAGAILARPRFGRHDWYREGAAHLTEQAAAGGGFASGGESDFLRDCFALLFLAKVNAPLLVLKAQWTGDWQPYRYDVRFLVNHVGRLLGQTLDWQIVPLDAPLDELMRAPILYLSGRGAGAWSEQETGRLKEYVEAGGFVLVEAAGGDAAFDRSVRAMMAQCFPEERLVRLPTDHPVYSSHFDIPPEQRPPLEAAMGPCWISVLYAPEGLSCEWDVADFEHVNSRMGVNVVAYVTGLQTLEGKLAEPVYYAPSAQPPQERGGAFTLGQVVHAGNWQPHKVAWRRVLEEVNAKAGLTVYSRPLPIRVDVESPFEAQVLYLTGVDELRLGPEARRALKLYLERGGFLFAEAACGSRRFDESFRALVRQVFPGQDLAELPLGHPLYEGGEPLPRVEYSIGAREQSPDLQRPMLEFLELNGRAALVYSRFDLSSAIDGHPCHRCPSILQPSAGRLALKIILYGLAS